jgi:hypothetical protein
VSTVPIFAPDGTLGDIPPGQLAAAVKAGAKPGVHIVAPDGSRGVIPADRTQDAVRSGAKLEPLQDQPIQHPGFWVTLGSDLGGMAKGAWHAAVDPLTDTHEDLVRKLHDEQSSDAAADNSPERQAHGAFYRNVTVPTAEAVGVNVPGMEQSAAQGDVGGVAGHAAAPLVATAATEGAVRIVPKIPGAARAVGNVAKETAGVIREAATPENIATAAGGAIGGKIGAIAGEPLGGAAAGAAAGRALGKTVAKRMARRAAESAPSGAIASASDELEGVTSPQTESASQSLPEVESPAASAIPAAQSPAAAPAATFPETAAPAATPQPVRATLSDLKQQINDSLGGKTNYEMAGGKPLEKGKPIFTRPQTNLKQQIADAAEKPAAQTPRAPLTDLQKQITAAADPLPEGFTATPDSSLLKGYKYDPAKQQFSAVLNNGESYTHGEVSPDQVKAFEDADSQGSAWTKKIKQGPGTVLMEKNGVPVRKAARTIVTDPETGRPEFSDALEAKQNTGPAATQTASQAVPTADEGDLTSLLQQSVEQVPAAKGGVFTTAEPAALAKRWGVDESAIADTDANVRGLNARQSQAYINKLAKSYKNGQPVQPVLETRDADNNIISVDGRHRALAAQKAGVERIPVIVRRVTAAADSPP